MDVLQTGSAEPLSFALVGNPNSGKTTLFNQLTGLRQKVGNYAGVTVEKKEGTCFSQHGHPLNLIDLPGIYSLASSSPDEAITRKVLLGHETGTPSPHGILAIVDASLLDRHLYLVLRLLELGRPTIVVLNMIDVAESKGLKIDISGLSHLLGTPVVAVQATQPKSLLPLRLLMSRLLTPPIHTLLTIDELSEPIQALTAYGATHRNLSLKIAESEALLCLSAPASCPFYPQDKQWVALLETYRSQLHTHCPHWRDTLINRRYAQVAGICERTITRTTGIPKTTLTERIDSWALHPLWGGIGLLFILGLLFYIIFAIAEIPKGWIEEGLTALGAYIETLLPVGELRSLIVHGIIAGAGGILAFLPQILLLFLGVGLLESSGYLARATFILDRPMQRVGLQGRSFIPFLSSYACAIPGIMATRTIESTADRLATIFIAPWASCSARLPVYLVMLGVMSPTINNSPFLKATCLLGLYLLGTFSAFAMAWLLRSSLLKSETGPTIIELPLYRRPLLSFVLWEMWLRAKLFLMRAGTVILGLSILLWYTLSHPILPDASPTAQLAGSYAGQFGHFIEPLLSPLGFDWRIAIGLIASFAAREVFVSTMAIIYGVGTASEVGLEAALRTHTNSAGLNTFTPLVCISLLVFFVYAMQCVSTLAIVHRETNSWRWPIFQLISMTAIAYLASLIVYQGGQLLGLS